MKCQKIQDQSFSSNKTNLSVLSTVKNAECQMYVLKRSKTCVSYLVLRLNRISDIVD